MAVMLALGYPALWAAMSTMEDVTAEVLAEESWPVIHHAFERVAPQMLKMFEPQTPSVGAILGGALGIAGFWGSLGTWLGHFIDKRGLHSVAIVAHFFQTNFTIADIRGLNGFTIEPQANGGAMFRQGDYSWPGQVSLTSAGKGLAHGDLELHVHKDGHPHIEHGRWLAVDTSEISEAEAHVQDNFEMLQKILGVNGEDGPASLSQALQLIEVAVASHATS